jgi:hypothetical protein
MSFENYQRVVHMLAEQIAQSIRDLDYEEEVGLPDNYFKEEVGLPDDYFKEDIGLPDDYFKEEPELPDLPNIALPDDYFRASSQEEVQDQDEVEAEEEEVQAIVSPNTTTKKKQRFVDPWTNERQIVLKKYTVAHLIEELQRRDLCVDVYQREPTAKSKQKKNLIAA